VHSNPIIITFCSLLFYKDLNDHLRNHRIEKLKKPLDQSLEEFYILRPSDFYKKPLDEYILHPFIGKTSYQPKKSYDQKILNRWYLFLRLSLNIELTIFRKQRIKKEIVSSKLSPSNVFVMVKKIKHKLIDKKEKQIDEIVIETRF
jgi:hypothetical protein